MHRRIQHSQPAASRVTNPTGSLLLLWALGLNIVLLLAVSGYLNFFHTVLTTTTRPYLQDQAVNLAEAGVQTGLWELNHNDSLFGVSWTDISGTPACIDIGVGAQCFARGPITLTATDGSNTPLGTYTVTVADPFSATPVILAHGNVTGSTISQAVRVTTEANTALTFRYAAFGRYMDIDGFEGSPDSLRIDSYQETYDPANPSHAGDIFANDQLMIWSSDVTVDGTAYVTPTTSVSPTPLTATITGGIEQEPYMNLPAELPDVVVPADLLAAPNQGGVRLSSGITSCSDLGSQRLHYTYLLIENDATFVLDEGCELYIDGPGYDGPVPGWGDVLDMALMLHDDAKIEARGNNRIFVNTGWLGASSRQGFVTTTQQPRDLQIYHQGVPREQTQQWNGCGAGLMQRAPFYGTIYSKHGMVYLGAYYDMGAYTYDPVAQFYGAFVAGDRFHLEASPYGETYDVSGLHYDESLRTLSVSGTGQQNEQNAFRTTSWQTQ